MARGIDPETGEYIDESRSAKRREALDILDLCEQLVGMSRAQLQKLPIPDHIMPVIEDTQRIKSHIAHKRQLAFLAKQMRREDDEVVDALRDAMDEDGDAARAETAQLHRAEQWRERILQDGDSALSEFYDEFPDADRQLFRTLARNATQEKLKNKPPRAFRELFREIRGLMSGDADAGEHSDDSDDDNDW